MLLKRTHKFFPGINTSHARRCRFSPIFAAQGFMEKSVILYAEDDADDRFIFELSFAPYKDEAELLTFQDGLEIINYLRNTPDAQPSLIVLDINMPMLDGKDVLRLLRDIPRYASIPAVLLTTSSAPQDRFFAEHFHAGFITKPMEETEMQEIIKKLLGYCKAPV